MMVEALETVGDYDNLDPMIEDLTRQAKDVRRCSVVRTENSFTLTAEARVQGTRELLQLDIRIHGRRGSRVQALLSRRDGTIVRLWHYHQSVHRNPDGSQVAPTHKHFSTVGLPISGMNHRGNPTWAYSTYDINPEVLADVVRGFAQECNILGLQLPSDL